MVDCGVWECTCVHLTVTLYLISNKSFYFHPYLFQNNGDSWFGICINIKVSWGQSVVYIVVTSISNPYQDFKGGGQIGYAWVHLGS